MPGLVKILVTHCSSPNFCLTNLYTILALPTTMSMDYVQALSEILYPIIFADFNCDKVKTEVKNSRLIR